MVDMNLRRVRFKGTRWTILSDSDQKKILNLCPFCTLQPTCLITRRLDQLLDEFGLVANISECPTYRPHLTFRKPHLGLDGVFNTFRLGAAWARRVKVGGIVTLIDAQTEEEIGVAEVTEIHCAPFEEVAAKHAWKNHMLLEASLSMAPELLYRVMVNYYGSTFMKKDRPTSVIYLRRLEKQDGPRNQG